MDTLEENHPPAQGLNVASLQLQFSSIVAHNSTPNIVSSQVYGPFLGISADFYISCVKTLLDSVTPQDYDAVSALRVALFTALSCSASLSDNQIDAQKLWLKDDLWQLAIESEKDLIMSGT